MALLWIVHRERHERSALARLAAAGEDSILGAPGEPRFDAAPDPDVILLGLTGDFEAELGFTHRVASRLGGGRWILFAEAGQLELARRLFDAVDAEVLRYPAGASELRERIRIAAARGGGDPPPLSERASRDALSARFGRWLADLELPELLRALDPRRGDVRVLITGEPGTGRATLARYVHEFGATSRGALVNVNCTSATTTAEILDAIETGTRARRARVACCVCLENVDELAAPVQRQLSGWIELGPPGGVLRTYRARWVATAGDPPALDAALRQALSGLLVRIPPLRERVAALPRLVNDAARAWCADHGERSRRFGEDALAVLEEYPWPGNVRELEAVVYETLAIGSADPVRAHDLHYDGCAFAPLNAGDVGALLFEDTEPELGLQPAKPEPAETGPVLESPGSESTLRRLAGAVAHEVGNPLTAIRTFAELLPEHHQDEEFRQRFSELVQRNAGRIHEVVERLSQLGSLSQPRRESVDVTAMLVDLLREARAGIRARRLLVLEELDSSQPHALGDREQLRFAFESILRRALELIPDRGDLYVASRHHAAGLRGGPSMRVLFRFPGPARAESDRGALEPDAAPPGLTPAENALEFCLAEVVIRAQGGALAVDVSDGEETVIVLDLPAL